MHKARAEARCCETHANILWLQIMASGTERDILQPKQVADLLQVSENTLIRWRKNKVGPRYYRRVGRIFYLRSDVERWEFSRPSDDP